MYARLRFSIFTPQRGVTDREILTPAQRTAAITELRQLRPKHPKLDMSEAVIRELASPPRNPGECIFARTTGIISADLITTIAPCQFGGNPDCTQCGCIASMGLAAVGHHRVVGPLTAGHLFMASNRLGRIWRKLQRGASRKPFVGGIPSSFHILAPEVSRAKRTP